MGAGHPGAKVDGQCADHLSLGKGPRGKGSPRGVDRGGGVGPTVW